MPMERNDLVRLKSILDSLVSAVVTIDPKGTIQSVNPAAERMFGYGAGEIVGQNVKMLMPEPYHAQHDGYIANYLATGQRRIIGIGREVVAKRKDGTVFPIHLSVSEFDIEGRRYFASGIVDLSEQKRQQARFQAIVDQMPDPLFMCDMDGRLALANPAATRVFGYEAEELIGNMARCLFSEAAAYGQVVDLRNRLLAGLVSDPVVHQCRRKDGTTFPGEVVVTLIRDAAGQPIGYLALIRDVTRERAQAEVMRKVQRIEAVGLLTGGIAHDFNNLLTVIIGNLELLEMRPLEEESRDLLKDAREAAEMGARLTRRLLTFARRRRLEPEILDLNDQVLGMMELLSRTLGENIELSANLGTEVWPTRVDPSEIESAIVNLAINARDAMPDGGRLLIETANVRFDDAFSEAAAGVAPGDYVKLAVSDTGKGMTPDVLARCFEPFFTTKEIGKGTGLGLSTVYRFVRDSGGNVTIYSEPGRGTSVKIYLPRASRVSAARPEISVREPAPHPGGATILVVEDNEQVRRLTVRRIRELGYATVDADSGPAAVAILSGGEPVSLVFSDVVMAGGMSGFELAGWVRDNRPGLPVLLTSGYTQGHGGGSHGRDAPGMLLSKPYSQRQLAEALRTALKAS